MLNLPSVKCKCTREHGFPGSNKLYNIYSCILACALVVLLSVTVTVLALVGNAARLVIFSDSLRSNSLNHSAYSLIAYLIIRAENVNYP